MEFTIRTTKPSSGNKYYITKGNGGYSDAVKGFPQDKECDVLSNCVGYAYGRFNEIGQYGCCKYLAPVNAEKFILYKGDCQTGMIPEKGACMVWQKGDSLSGSDGAGHVAIVEKVISETEVYTSESSYGGKAFYNKTRKKGNDGNWGLGKDYTFLGFIYNPSVTMIEEKANETVKQDNDNILKIGDIVSVKQGSYYYNSKKSVPEWVCNKTWIIKSISNNRVVIDKSVDGKSSICSPIHVNDLIMVKSQTEFKSYKIMVTTSTLNIRKGAGTSYKKIGCIHKGDIYEIVSEANGVGAKRWGKIQPSSGWISLDYTEKIC